MAELDPVSLGIEAGTTLLDTGLGAWQYFKGKQEEKNNPRPTYQIPDEIKQNLSQAQMMALEGLPAEQKQQYIQNLQRTSNFALNAMSSRKSGLAGLSGLVQNQNDAYGNLLSQDSAARQQNRQMAMQQGQVMANYKDSAYQQNQSNPYYEKTAQAQAMQGAGLKNIFGGIQSAANYGAGHDFGKSKTSPPMGTPPTSGGGFNGLGSLGDYNIDPSQLALTAATG